MTSFYSRRYMHLQLNCDLCHANRNTSCTFSGNASRFIQCVLDNMACSSVKWHHPTLRVLRGMGSIYDKVVILKRCQNEAMVSEQGDLVRLLRL